MTEKTEKQDSFIKQNSFIPETTLAKVWGAFGGNVYFPVGIALSAELTQKREKMLTLPEAERPASLDGFRIDLLADVLTEDPYLVRPERIAEKLKEKAAQIIEDMTADGNPPEERHKPEIYTAQRLTEEEVKALREPLPDFPSDSRDIGERAKQYFGTKDKRGRYVFQRLLEEIVSDYWDWALPRPISPASEYALTNSAISTKN